MLKLHASRRILLVLVGCALIGVLATSAAADTIYMKNGRVIRTSEARIEGDRVIFLQYGGEVAIPLSLVDRVEANEARGPQGTAISRPTQQVPAAGTQGDQGESQQAETGGEEEVPPEQTREYWQERINTIAAERTELEDSMVELRREERAFLFSQRSTAETRRKIDEAQTRLQELDQELVDLKAEARRLKVPPGWLRIREQGGAAQL